jgi:NADPH:quinone reductase-like Zn-dependent oxidoreductase
MSFTEAATLPCAALTAWHALMERGRPLVAGETVLCLGTGGVSIFALQIAKAAGARVILTSSSHEKLGRARELGADETIHYLETPEWDREVMRITEKRGVDRVVEVGGPGTIERSLNSVAAGGFVSLIGVLTGFDPPQANLFTLVKKNAELQGIYVGHREMFVRMNAFLEQQAIRPVIDRSFPFAEAASAYAHLEGASHFGKVVVEV